LFFSGVMGVFGFDAMAIIVATIACTSSAELRAASDVAANSSAQQRGA
jgi:hypothetical protein